MNEKLTAKMDTLTQENKKLKRATQKLSFLNDLSEAISLSFEFEEIVRIVIKKSIRALGAEQGSIILVGGDESDPETLVRSMITQKQSTPFSLQEVIVGWVIVKKSPLNLPDPRKDPRFAGLEYDEHVQSIACVPMMIKSTVIGVLVVFNKQDGDAFSDDDIKLLTIIASQSAQVVDNARLYGVEKLHEELKATQAHLIQSKKMASLGALVAGLVHEINTPVAAIMSRADIGERRLYKLRAALQIAEKGGVEDVDSHISALIEDSRTIQNAASRLSDLINSLKSFAHLDASLREEYDLHIGLDSALTLLEHDVRERIGITKEYGVIPLVDCNPAEINQVFMHILTNAIDAIDGEGSITIETKQEADHVSVLISDTGRGISERKMKALFEPAFNKEGDRVKAGIGLFTCWNIVEKHGGRISVASDVDKGSAFTVLLPVRPVSGVS